MTLAAALTLTILSALPAAAVDDPALQQEVEADEDTVDGREVIDTGHVDLGPRFIDDTWRLQARDDRTHPPVWRYPHDVVFQMADTSLTPAPDNDDYAFLGVEPGTSLYVVPQTQEPEVIWLGWNTQDPEVTERIDRGATLTLHDVEGPGELFLFLQEGVSGEPNVLWDTTDPYPQDLWMEVNTHTHANWVFTEPGTYRLAVEMHADLVDGSRGTDTATLRFAVGDGTDAQAAFDLDELEVATDQDGDATDDDGADVGGDDAGGGTDLLLPLLGAGAVLLLAVAIFTIVSGRRARAAGDPSKGAS